MAAPTIYRGSLDGSEMARVLVGGRWYMTTVGQLVAHALSDPRLAAIEARLAALEGKPQEVVPFSGSITTGVLAIGSKTFTVSGLTGLLAGERIVAVPVGALPAGVAIAGARVPADGTVEVTLSAVVALLTSKTIALTITALR